MNLHQIKRKLREASRTHSTLGKGRRLHGGRSSAHPKGAMVSGKTHTYDKPAGTAKKPGRQKIVATPVKKEDVEFVDKILALDHKELGFETQHELVEYAISHYEGVAGGVIGAAALAGLYKVGKAIKKRVTVKGRLERQQGKLQKLKDKESIKDTKREIKTMKKGGAPKPAKPAKPAKAKKEDYVSHFW